MYKAIKDIGGYSIGDEIPDSQAEVWLEMYEVPHVEKVYEKDVVEEKPEEDSEVIVENVVDDLLEDYLGRNQSVVRKNVSEDRLSTNRLKELLKIEKSDKNRPLVINAIQQRLKN